MGDLRKFYSLANVVFVGRTLVPMGGSDMMEAAGLGKAVVVGPYTENFSETVKLLSAAGGIAEAADGKNLTEEVRRLLLRPDEAEEIGRRARQIIKDNKGATRRSVEAIIELLGYEMPYNQGQIAVEKLRSESK